MSLAPLILVAGPSGAGKDSLIGGALSALTDDPKIVFARRVITRPASAGGEDNDFLDEDGFERVRAEGGFMLSWRAHGLSYGIPAGLARVRADGTALVANVSRSVIGEARHRLAPVGIIIVTAPLDVLAARLAGRGREDEDAIRRRLAREEPLAQGDDVRVVDNSRSLAEGVAAFLAALDDIRRMGS